MRREAYAVLLWLLVALAFAGGCLVGYQSGYTRGCLEGFDFRSWSPADGWPKCLEVEK